MSSEEYHNIISEMVKIHAKKSADYAKEDNSFSNFEFAAELVKHFKFPIDQVFVTLIGIKLARLSELLNGKAPLNEAIEDTFIDGANYFALWGAYHSRYSTKANLVVVNNTDENDRKKHFLLGAGFEYHISLKAWKHKNLGIIIPEAQINSYTYNELKNRISSLLETNDSITR